MYNTVTIRKEERVMRKRYLIILTGLILSFALLTGCGMTRTAEQSQTSDVSSTQREEELQAEIDALQQEIDELKGAQDQQDTATSAEDEQTSDNSQTADRATSAEDEQTSDNSQTADSGKSSGSSGNTSDGMISMEEAQNIALERVPGATAQDMSIELDRDDGWYIYEGDILYNRMEYEFEIDANTGNILKWEEERW